MDLGKIEQEAVQASLPSLKEQIAHNDAVKSRSAQSWKLDGNSEDGDVVEYLHHDEDAGKIYVEQVQDTEPVLEDAKRRHNAGEFGSSEMKHAGLFPLVIVHAWLNQRGLRMQDFGRSHSLRCEFLNDSAHKAFRIWPGRVS